jgi:hypothetical protein
MTRRRWRNIGHRVSAIARFGAVVRRRMATERASRNAARMRWKIVFTRVAPYQHGRHGGRAAKATSASTRRSIISAWHRNRVAHKCKGVNAGGCALSAMMP